MSDELPCGTPLELLAAHVADGAALPDPAHQAECPHCGAALTALRAAADGLRALADEPVRVPPELGARVLARIRHEGERLLVAQGPRGRDTIDERVLGQVARAAARGVPAVRSVSVAVSPEPAGLAVTLRLTVQMGVELMPLAARARERVLADAEALVGIRLVRVDITIEDVV